MGIRGLKTETKDACTEFACNNAPAEVNIGQRCYHCSVTIDHQFNLVGAGDVQCLSPTDDIHGELDHGHVWECGADSGKIVKFFLALQAFSQSLK